MTEIAPPHSSPDADADADAGADAAGAAPVRYRRRPFGFLRYPGWVLTLGIVAGPVVLAVNRFKVPHRASPGGFDAVLAYAAVTAVAGATVALCVAASLVVLRVRRPAAAAATGALIGSMVFATFLTFRAQGCFSVTPDESCGVPTGGGWVLLVVQTVWQLALMAAFVLFYQRRLCFDRVPDPVRILVWGVASGVVGSFVLDLTVYVPVLDDGLAAVGLREESVKLLVPVVLWFTGRFREPREGLLLVMISAVTFGVLESVQYAAFGRVNPSELLHPLLTSFVAAVAWRAASGRRSWFPVAGVAPPAMPCRPRWSGRRWSPCW
jgi:hypothetical protein